MQSKDLKLLNNLENLVLAVASHSQSRDSRCGEILGDDQSGQIQTVGYSLYTEYLEGSQRYDKGEYPEDPLIKESTEINLHSSSLIPDSYLPNVNTRLILYKRIAAAQNEAELKKVNWR